MFGLIVDQKSVGVLGGYGVNTTRILNIATFGLNRNYTDGVLGSIGGVPFNGLFAPATSIAEFIAGGISTTMFESVFTTTTNTAKVRIITPFTFTGSLRKLVVANNTIHAFVNGVNNTSSRSITMIVNVIKLTTDGTRTVIGTTTATATTATANVGLTIFDEGFGIDFGSTIDFNNDYVGIELEYTYTASVNVPNGFRLKQGYFANNGLYFLT